ncbi:MAG TPA: response regulator transcription factor [Bauldia sp.]|nr:response regulator transcription factor [Bauldia sp.]
MSAHRASPDAPAGHWHPGLSAVAPTVGPEVTVALADDHPVILEGVSALLSARPGYRVIAKGSSADDARMIAETIRPDIMLMDLNMPGDALAAISGIVQGGSSTKILVFTAYSSIDSAMKALDSGAGGLVLKGATCDELFQAIESVLAGEMFIARQYANQLMMGLRSRSHPKISESERLNVREKQILDRLMKAETNREIAVGLSISEKTVKRYMTALMLKLKARNRVEVVLRAQKLS